MSLKNYDSYIELVAKAYKEAPDFEESEKYRWEILNKSNYTFFKRLISKVEVIFVTNDKDKVGDTLNILNKKYTIEYMSDEPYDSQQEMKESFEKSGILYISTDYSNHPIFNLEDNIVFRTVHDYIVHILSNVDFSGKGEIAAFNAHAKLAPKETIPAIFTEVVGQASHFLVYGNFPKQKITVLKGFDYKNVGEVEGCVVKNKELFCDENNDIISENIKIVKFSNFEKVYEDDKNDDYIIKLISKSEKGNRYFNMLKTAMFQHYDSPKGELSKLTGGEERRKKLVSKLSKEDKKLYRKWLKTKEGQDSLKNWD